VNRLAPRTTFLSGATIALVAGAAIYGAISSSASAPTSTSPKAASASTSVPRASAAHCTAGQELEHGVCIVHLERAVVVRGPGSAAGPSSDSSSSAHAEEPAEHAGAHGAEHEGDTGEHAKDAAGHTRAGRD
jgi:hypothetical protein